MAHWKTGGHRQRCLPPHARSVDKMQKKKAGGAAAGGGAAEEEECPICLDRLQGAVCTLPCNHRFHASCIEQVRNFGLQQVCPMCREELPPDADTMGFDGYRLYCPVQKRVERADDSWGPLSRDEQESMDEVVRLWGGAASQGDARAQYNLGIMYDKGQGVEQSYSEAMRFYRMAAAQGYASAQINLGNMYREGHGVEVDNG